MTSSIPPIDFAELARRTGWPQSVIEAGSGRSFAAISQATVESQGDLWAPPPEALLKGMAESYQFFWEDESRSTALWQSEPGGQIRPLVVLPKGFLPTDPNQLCPDGHAMPKDDGTSPDLFWMTLDLEFNIAFGRYLEELERWSKRSTEEQSRRRPPYYWDESEVLRRCTSRCGWLFFEGRFLAPESLLEGRTI